MTKEQSYHVLMLLAKAMKRSYKESITPDEIEAMAFILRRRQKVS